MVEEHYAPGSAHHGSLASMRLLTRPVQETNCSWRRGQPETHDARTRSNSEHATKDALPELSYKGRTCGTLSPETLSMNNLQSRE